MLVATQPLAVFSHYLHDHMTGHGHTASGGQTQLEDADAPGHGADHGHVWMIPAITVVTPQVRQPQVIAALPSLEHAPLPSAEPFPPFSPPRA